MFLVLILNDWLHLPQCNVCMMQFDWLEYALEGFNRHNFEGNHLRIKVTGPHFSLGIPNITPVQSECYLKPATCLFVQSLSAFSFSPQLPLAAGVFFSGGHVIVGVSFQYCRIFTFQYKVT